METSAVPVYGLTGTSVNFINAAALGDGGNTLGTYGGGGVCAYEFIVMISAKHNSAIALNGCCDNIRYKNLGNG